jgi:hypothetical protein
MKWIELAQHCVNCRGFMLKVMDCSNRNLLEQLTRRLLSEYTNQGVGC